MAKLVHNVQKKQHKERSQIASRARFGLLEKKKDYKLRSANFHKNQAKLKLLKEKAQSHNDDEYYHAMTNRTTNDMGVLIQKREFSDSLSNDQVLLMKGQDMNYLNMVSTKEANKIKKGLNNANLFKSNGKHTVFVENKEEFDRFIPEEYFETDKALLNRRENRLKTEQLLADDLNLTPDAELLEDALALKKKELDVLKQRIERENQLTEVKTKLQLQRELMKPGSKKKTLKDGKVVFKWKNQRKK